MFELIAKIEPVSVFWDCFSISFIFLGGINIKKINREYADFQMTKKLDIVDVDDIKPIFSFSKTGRNIVVIMLDRAESFYFESILKDKCLLDTQELIPISRSSIKKVNEAFMEFIKGGLYEW